MSKSNSDINFFTTKKSFCDKSFTSLNDVFLEINKISKKEYGIQSKELNLNSKKYDNNNLITFDNGILLINSFFTKLKKNCLIFFRLEKPILVYDNKFSDIIFTLLTPNNLRTSNKLQVLAKLTRILKNPNIRKEIKGVKNPEDVLALLLLT
ncbi:PTS sugar transporter subunit IIA [Alphaproteobacteria bacterium]|nr:PTS sugar transporter subunit IIA [Alphaproteobacteria bacterium]